MAVHKLVTFICKISGTTINDSIQLSADSQSHSEYTTTNIFQELATEDATYADEHKSPFQSEDVAYLSSGEEQPHYSSSSSDLEQQSIPNSSAPESSVPHIVCRGLKYLLILEILLPHQNLMLNLSVNQKFEQF